MLSNYSNKKNDTIKVITESIDFVRKGIIKLCKYLLQKKKKEKKENAYYCVSKLHYLLYLLASLPHLFATIILLIDSSEGHS